MAKDKDIQSTGFDNRSKEFQDNLVSREDVYELVKETLIDETEKAFKLKGIQPNEKHAGVYSTGKEYGKGAEEGRYNATYSNNTKTQINKVITYGAKKLICEIAVVFDPKNQLLKLSYKGPSGAVFVGHGNEDNSEGKLIDNKLTISTEDKKDLKKELKEFFKNQAKKEVIYLLSTKMNVEDKLDTTPEDALVKENKNIAKMNLNSLLTSSEEEISSYFGNKIQESKEKLDKLEKHSEDIKKLNTKDIKGSDKKLMFDELSEEEKKDYKKYFKKTMKDMFPDKKLSDLSVAEKEELFKSANKGWESKEEMVDEITASGPTGSGAGGYLTPNAFVNTNYFKNKEKRPSIKKEKNEDDTFWTKVEMEKGGWPPKGMSKNFVQGQHDLNESNVNTKKVINNHKFDTNKKKFFNEEENIELGINKRYLITDQLNESEQFDKWKKLSTHNLFETVKKAEDVISKEECDILNECACQDKIQYVDPKLYIDGPSVEEYLENEFEEANSGNEEDMVNVQKSPESFVVYKLNKEEFMNESKRYIFDHNTKEYVVHPNFKA